MNGRENIIGRGGAVPGVLSAKRKHAFLAAFIVFLAAIGIVSELWLRLGSTSLAPGMGPNNAFITYYCGLRGGDLINSGCGIAGCVQRCVFAYGDAGQACAGSGDCGGRCLVVSPKMPDPLFSAGKTAEAMKDFGCVAETGGWWRCPDRTIEGRCEARPPANCATDWELQDGLVKPQFADCNI